MRRAMILISIVSLNCLFAVFNDHLIAAEPASTDLRPVEPRWTGFLTGNANPGIDAKSLPLTWTPTSVTWKSPIRGDGQSSPVVWSDAVFVTSVEGPNKEACFVTRISLADGTVAWSYVLSVIGRFKTGHRGALWSGRVNGCRFSTYSLRLATPGLRSGVAMVRRLRVLPVLPARGAGGRFGRF